MLPTLSWAPDTQWTNFHWAPGLSKAAGCVPRSPPPTEIVAAHLETHHALGRPLSKAPHSLKCIKRELVPDKAPYGCLMLL